MKIRRQPHRDRVGISAPTMGHPSAESSHVTPDSMLMWGIMDTSVSLACTSLIIVLHRMRFMKGLSATRGWHKTGRLLRGITELRKAIGPLYQWKFNNVETSNRQTVKASSKPPVFRHPPVLLLVQRPMACSLS